MEQRKCNKCGETKPLDDYYKTGRKTDTNKDNRHYTCKECTKARVSKAHHENPNLQRNRDLRRLYNIGIEEYEKLLAEQGGHCAVCEATQPGGRHATQHFPVDHCHTTGEVRGLLCHNCNTALGLLKDDPSRIANLITYLAKH